jgi:hypothetical protein
MTPIPGPPVQDITIVYGADLNLPVARRNAGQPWPFPSDATAFVRLGDAKAVGDPHPCVIDAEGRAIMRIESEHLDPHRSIRYTLLTSDPTSPTLETPWLTGKLVREK